MANQDLLSSFGSVLHAGFGTVVQQKYCWFWSKEEFKISCVIFKKLLKRLCSVEASFQDGPSDFYLLVWMLLCSSLSHWVGLTCVTNRNLRDVWHGRLGHKKAFSFCSPLSLISYSRASQLLCLEHSSSPMESSMWWETKASCVPTGINLGDMWVSHPGSHPPAPVKHSEECSPS